MFSLKAANAHSSAVNSAKKAPLVLFYISSKQYLIKTEQIRLETEFKVILKNSIETRPSKTAWNSYVT